jgi:tetratricopeptide (TPR) repeat protein
VAVASLAAQAAPDTSALGLARAAWERTPENADSIIWYGRRVGYTGAFADAVAIFAEGIRLHPDDARMYRHRGHRYISLREFALARADLERAHELVRGRPDEVEPDGQPNARGIPTSTLHSNIRYHLALSYFLLGDLPTAGGLWEEDAKLATNLDQRVASTYWWVICAAQLGQMDVALGALAPIRRDWDIIENGSYHRMLLYFRGDIPEDSVLPRRPSALEVQTIGNGVAQWHLAMNRRAQAITVMRSVLETGPSASFGFVAVEATAARLGVIPAIQKP